MLSALVSKAADSPRFCAFISSAAKRLGVARRFVAGETEAEAIKVARQLNQAGLRVSLDLLGEGVTGASAALEATEAYLQLLETIAAIQVDANISIKLTQLGLEFDPGLCANNLERILQVAQEKKNLVRIDMESSQFTQGTLDLFYQMRTRFPDAVGIVIQAYLYRSQSDIGELAKLGADVRLCKGAYHESAEVAFPRKSDVNQNFIRLLEVLLGSGVPCAIASHDDKILSWTERFVREGRVKKSLYEFQMLYGIRRNRQLQLAAAGHNVRIYVPFGTQWTPYLMRRLAERPANFLFFLRNLFKR